MKKHFPDPRRAPDDVVDIRDEINVDILLEAYSAGIFPWPEAGLPIFWFCPLERGVLDFNDFHVAKSLQKIIRKKIFTVTFDQAFERVIAECRKQPRPGQSGTWITPRLLKAYVEFHKKGFAHSVECWQNEKLVGGLYGVFVGGVFCGESMFYLVPDASKVALVCLVEYLKKHGLKWMDIQMVTPFMTGFGGKYISRDEFLDRLRESKSCAPSLFEKMKA